MKINVKKKLSLPIKGDAIAKVISKKSTGTRKESTLVGATEAAIALGVERRTLFRWAKAGRLPYVKHGSHGHWYFERRTIDAFADGSIAAATVSASAAEEEEATKRTDVIYARVSTRKQTQHLENQVLSLGAKHPNCVVIRDCASGLNFRRKGLETLLQLVFAGRVRNVYLAYRDRLCRFAYDLLERLFREFGTTICVDAHDDDAAESVLADDIIAIITVFGARLYGRRSGGSRRGKEKQSSSVKQEKEDKQEDGQGKQS
jgi:excisionase family DNA binding protein